VSREFETIRIERRGPAAVVFIDREEKRNAMTVTFFRELPRVLELLDGEPELRGIVLTGAGDQAFSAGGDIKGFGDLTNIADYRRQLRLVYDAFHSVERCGLPVIGAINGVAYAGGTELTLACDFAIASERARFSFREATVGLMPGYGVVRGPATIGKAWTRWLAMTADTVDAEQALQMGLVQKVVPHERLLDEALAVVDKLAAVAPLAVRLAKQFVNRDNAAGLAESIEATALLFTTEDHKEAQQAFVGKRDPEFTGR
jgi:enoyl-CoA hydratase/carnithine racemase